MGVSSPIRFPGRSVRASVLALLLGASAALGCQSGSSTPTPGASSVVLQQLTRAGFRIDEAISGDAGCSDPGLVGNATRLRVTHPPVDERPTTLYLYLFRTRDYAAQSPTVDACLAEIERTTGTDQDRVDVAPYTVIVSGLGPESREALVAALEAAARGG